MKKIYVIGGANIDILAKPTSKIIPYDSNPGDVFFSYGGVGKNIAENICQLGAQVCFVTCLGNDAYGKEIYKYLKDKNIDLEYTKIIDNMNTSVYLALMNEDDLYVGFNDMKILNNLSANYINSFKDVIDDDDMVVFDSNLNEETINYIAHNLKGYKVADAISCNKVKRLKNAFDAIDILKFNKLEADEINGEELKGEKDILNFTRKLNNVGLKEVLVSHKNKLFVGIDNKLFCYEHNGYKDNPCNVTGAGDALCAGYSYSRFMGKSLIDSVKIGTAMAIMTVDDIKSVTSFDTNDINEVLKTFDIFFKEIEA